MSEFKNTDLRIGCRGSKLIINGDTVFCNYKNIKHSPQVDKVREHFSSYTKDELISFIWDVLDNGWED